MRGRNSQSSGAAAPNGGRIFVECDVDPKSWKALPLTGTSHKFLRGAIHPATTAVEGPEATNVQLLTGNVLQRAALKQERNFD